MWHLCMRPTNDIKAHLTPDIHYDIKAHLTPDIHYDIKEQNFWFAMGDNLLFANSTNTSHLKNTVVGRSPSTTTICSKCGHIVANCGLWQLCEIKRIAYS